MFSSLDDKMKERLANHLIIKIWTRLFLITFFVGLFSYGILGENSAIFAFFSYSVAFLMLILIFVIIADIIIARYMKKRLGTSIIAKKRISADNIGDQLANHLVIKTWIKLFFISFFGWLVTNAIYEKNNILTSFLLYSAAYLAIFLILVMLIDIGIAHYIKKRGKDNDGDLEPKSVASITQDTEVKEQIDKSDRLSDIESSPKSSSFCVVCGSDNVNVNGRCINCGAKLD